jgi:hypothetical protein
VGVLQVMVQLPVTVDSFLGTINSTLFFSWNALMAEIVLNNVMEFLHTS